MSEHLIISISQAVVSVCALVALLVAQWRTHQSVRQDIRRTERVADDVARLAVLVRDVAQYLRDHPNGNGGIGDIDDLHE